MLRSAHRVVNAATEYLERRLGSLFEKGVSVGLMGSFARDALTAVSDLDYYVVFDLAALEEGGVVLDDAAMRALVDGALRHAQTAHPGQVLAKRLSIFWTTLRCLAEADYRTGRWDPYDRAAFLCQGKHLAGKVITKETLPRVPRRAVIADSATFFVEVLRVKLDSVGFFHGLAQLGARELADIGEVALVKSVLMPVRLLYTSLPVHEERLIVDTDSAVVECAGLYQSQPWWPLVSQALKWRQSPPESALEWQSGALLLRAHVTGLYVFCLTRYAEVLRGQGDAVLATRLQDWSVEVMELARGLGRSPTPSEDAAGPPGECA